MQSKICINKRNRNRQHHMYIQEFYASNAARMDSNLFNTMYAKS